MVLLTKEDGAVGSEAEPTDESVATGTTPSVTPTGSGVLLRLLVEVAIPYGVTPEGLLGDHFKSLQSHEPLQLRMPLSEFRRLLRRATELTGDPALAARLALRSTEGSFDMFGPLIRHLPNARAALADATRFGPLLLEGAQLRLKERTGQAWLRLELPHAHDESDGQLAEFAVAGLLRLLRLFGAQPHELHRVHVEFAQPAHHRTLGDLLELPIEYGCPETVIEFDGHVLDRPNLHHNASFQTLVRAQAEQHLADVSRGTRLGLRVRTYLRNQAVVRVPDMQVVARDLHMSVRSLRRRLREEGESYRELGQDVQQEHACALLRNPQLSAQEVAAALGFADTTSFHKAFKRWTGQTTSEYRKQALATPTR